MLTIAPAAEACQALVARINSGTAYTLPQPAEYVRDEVNLLEQITTLRVDVEAETETQLDETLAGEDGTSHVIRVWVRDKPPNLTAAAIDARCLIVRQIFLRLNNWDSDDQRVRVWDCDENPNENPNKLILRDARLFVSCITLRVEVGPTP